jgi:16S rRNA (guanine(527)-N(7))-methyltransferase RsmG
MTILPVERFKALFSEYGLSVDDGRYGKFLLYAELLEDWNTRMNLTRITDPEGITVKHFLDSVLPLKYARIPQAAAVVDVGAGAGFPGYPMKILRPDISITSIDSRAKRVEFLRYVSERICVNAVCLHSRAEDAGRNLSLRENFDAAVARAVSALPLLCEYCLPLVRVGGVFLAMKGPNEEPAEAETMVSALGGEIAAVSDYALPNGDRRSLLSIVKVKPTPEKYPRKTARITR